MLVSLTIQCDWPGCAATLTVSYRAEIGQKHRWKAESDGEYSQHLCPAHKRKDWHEVAMAQFSDNLRKAHRTPGGASGTYRTWQCAATRTNPRRNASYG